tara:strand:+ start:1131 stop:1340 length:210 start_codon:yes stop_codon:yes gene_type:complete
LLARGGIAQTAFQRPFQLANFQHRHAAAGAAEHAPVVVGVSAKFLGQGFIHHREAVEHRRDDAGPDAMG